jgi:DNA-dependent RNA polymerase auxiliary subunit epsilon
MIFKVLYQDLPGEVPIRERTKTMYVDAENEREVRKKLADRDINIEYIQPLEGLHLEYEQRSEHFKVENV